MAMTELKLQVRVSRLSMLSVWLLGNFIAKPMIILECYLSNKSSDDIADKWIARCGKFVWIKVIEP